MFFFSHVPRITQPKNQVPRSKALLCSPRIDGQTHTHTHTKVTTVGTLSGFQEFFLQPIIKDRPNKGICPQCYFLYVTLLIKNYQLFVVQLFIAININQSLACQKMLSVLYASSLWPMICQPTVIPQRSQSLKTRENAHTLGLEADTCHRGAYPSNIINMGTY